MWWTDCYSAVWFFCCVLHEASLMLTYALWYFQGRDFPYAWLIFHSISTHCYQPFLHQLESWCCFKKKKVLSVSPLLKKRKKTSEDDKNSCIYLFVCLWKDRKISLERINWEKMSPLVGPSYGAANWVRGTCACLTWRQPLSVAQEVCTTNTALSHY